MYFGAFADTTTTDQSDAEFRIVALEEQLRQRKLEADRLRRKEKHLRKEKLRSKEQSLLKQLEVKKIFLEKGTGSRAIASMYFCSVVMKDRREVITWQRESDKIFFYWVEYKRKL